MQKYTDYKLSNTDIKVAEIHYVNNYNNYALIQLIMSHYAISTHASISNYAKYVSDCINSQELEKKKYTEAERKIIDSIKNGNFTQGIDNDVLFFTSSYSKWRGLALNASAFVLAAFASN